MGGGSYHAHGRCERWSRPHLLPGRSRCCCRRGRKGRGGRGTLTCPELRIRGAEQPLGEEETWRRPRAGAAGAGAPQVSCRRRSGCGGRAVRFGGCRSPCASGRLWAAVRGGSAAGPGGGLFPQQVRGRPAPARACRAPGCDGVFLPPHGGLPSRTAACRPRPEPAVGAAPRRDAAARPGRRAELCRVRGDGASGPHPAVTARLPGPAEGRRRMCAVVLGAPFVVLTSAAFGARCAARRLHRDGDNAGAWSRAGEARAGRQRRGQQGRPPGRGAGARGVRGSGT